MRRPMLTGALLGAVAFLSDAMRPAPVPPTASPAVEMALSLGLDRADALVARRLRRDMAFLGFTGDEDALLAQAVQLGLHESDAVVRRYLRLKLSRMVEAGLSTPTDAEMQAWLAANPNRFRQPARMQTVAQPGRWLTARDLERQYPHGPPEILAVQPARPAALAGNRARIRAAMRAERRAVVMNRLLRDGGFREEDVKTAGAVRE
ncbi:MAG: hypothetical protein AAFV53_22840 [Myxococcota bacterium]